MMTSRKYQSGVALMDLAVATLLATAALSGVTGVISARIDADRAQTVERAIDTARTALLAHAMTRGHLPCPANGRIAQGEHGAGIAGRYMDGRCEHGATGVLPWVTLGLAELDPWHQRYTYRVAPDLAMPPEDCSGDLDAPPAPDRGCLQIPLQSHSPRPTLQSFVIREVRMDGDGRSTTEPVANGVGAVLVSHGPNGALAWRATGSRDSGAFTRPFEADNAKDNATTYFAPSAQRSGRECRAHEAGNCALDDTVGWVTRGELLVALARAGRRMQ